MSEININVQSGETKVLTFKTKDTYISEDMVFNINGTSNDKSDIYYGTTTGTSDTQTLALKNMDGTDATISDYYEGLTIVTKFGNTTSTNSTLNVNEKGSVNLYYDGSSNSEYFNADSIYVLVCTKDPSDSTKWCFKGTSHDKPEIYYGTTTGSKTTQAIALKRLDGTAATISGYYEGLTIITKFGYNSNTATTINVNSLGAVNLYYSVSARSTYFTAGCIYMLVCTKDPSDNTKWCFKAVMSYNSNNDTKVTQTPLTNESTTYAYWRPLVLGYNNNTTEDITLSSTANLVYTTQGIRVQPSTGMISAGGFKKIGGSETQFLKADGSVDENEYMIVGSKVDWSNINNAPTSLSEFNNDLVLITGSDTIYNTDQESPNSEWSSIVNKNTVIYGDSVNTSVNKLDNKISGLADELVETEDVINNAFTNIQSSVGLEKDMSLSLDVDYLTVIKNLTNVRDALIALDGAIGSNTCTQAMSVFTSTDNTTYNVSQTGTYSIPDGRRTYCHMGVLGSSLNFVYDSTNIGIEYHLLMKATSNTNLNNIEYSANGSILIVPSNLSSITVGANEYVEYTFMPISEETVIMKVHTFVTNGTGTGPGTLEETNYIITETGDILATESGDELIHT